MLGSRVVRTRSGEFFVAPTVDPGAIAKYDHRGAFIRAIGRRGGGPGEFDDISALAVSPQDSLYVMHHDRRMSVLGSDGSFVRTTTVQALAARSEFLVAREEQVVVVGSAARKLYLLHADGSVLRSYQAPNSGGFEERYDVLAARGYGELWAAPPFRYELDRFDSAGTWRGRYVRRLPWFPEEPRRGISPARVEAISPADGSRLWILLSRPNPAWVPPRRPSIERGESRPVQLSGAQVVDRYDHVLELFDPATGRVITSGHIAERYVRGFADRDHIYTAREDELGDLSIEIWHLRVVDPRR